MKVKRGEKRLSLNKKSMKINISLIPYMKQNQ